MLLLAISGSLTAAKNETIFQTKMQTHMVSGDTSSKKMSTIFDDLLEQKSTKQRIDSSNIQKYYHIPLRITEQTYVIPASTPFFYCIHGVHCHAFQCGCRAVACQVVPCCAKPCCDTCWSLGILSEFLWIHGRRKCNLRRGETVPVRLLIVTLLVCLSPKLQEYFSHRNT